VLSGGVIMREFRSRCCRAAFLTVFAVFLVGLTPAAPALAGPPSPDPVAGPTTKGRLTESDLGKRDVVFASSDALASSVQFTDINPNNSDLDAADPDGASGGRTNGLAAVSGNNQMFYAATEWGGLYKTFDRGVTWSYLSGHLPTVTWDVEVDPGNTGTVYATSFYDGRTNPVSGINVSYDAGVTWTKPATADPPAGFCTDPARQTQPSAFGIGIRPDAASNVFIGTNCGVARSTDSGLTWTYLDADPTPGDGAARVWDVVAQAGGTIDVCGDEGHFRSTNNGATWAANNLPATGRCSIAVSPDETYVLFVVVGTRIFESDNGGTTWPTEFVNPSAQGRIPFVATNQRATTAAGNRFDMWFGDVRLHRAGCTTPAAPAPGGAARCPGSGAWAGPFTRSVGAHDDAGDLVFDSQRTVDACPMIFSSDGGVYRNTDLGADCQNPNWEQPNVTPHATWFFTMDGAHQAGDANEDLYFGLQDDGSWGTTTGGAASPTWHNQDCCDVFDVSADPNRVVYTVCCFAPPATRLFLRNPGLTGGAGMITAPPGNLIGFAFPDSIVRVADRQYGIVTTQGTFFTADITAGPPVYTELGAASDPGPCGLQAAISGGTPTFYAQVGCDPRQGNQVWKYSGTAPGGTWTRIDNNDGLTGGFGIFAVDPNNPNRLYASNLPAAGPQMVFSNDGGLTWDPDPELDALMTGGGAFPYRNTRGPTEFTGFGGYPQPSLVAFDQEDSNILVAGGRESGVFLSANGGQNWGLITDPLTSNVSGIPHLPRPFYAYFDHEPAGKVNIYVGTVGRGVWRLTPPSADVSITKTDSPDPVNAGEQLFYTITVTNNGPDEAQNVTVVDTLPAPVTFITDDMGACVEGPTDTLTCSLGNIAAGASKTLVIKVQVDADAVENAGGPFGITDTATVSTSGSIDPDTSNNTATASTIVEESADLTVTKICKPDGPIPAGETATCTIFVDNLGPSVARNVVLTDTIVANGAFTATATPSQGVCFPIVGGVITCNLGNLDPGARATVVVEITATDATDVNDKATVTSDTPDPNPANNQAEGRISVTARADLNLLDKTDAPDPATAGAGLTYTLTIRNDGPSTAVNVLLKDFLPAGVTIDSVSSSGASSCKAGVPGDPFRPTVCAYDSLAPTDVRTMTIQVTIDAGVLGTIHNDARVSSDTFDPNNSNDLATEPTTVGASADLEVTKADLPDPVVAGTRLTYELTLVNHGPSNAKDVVVEDTLPAEVTFQSVAISDEDGTCVLIDVPPNTVSCRLGTLAPNEGSPVRITIDVLVHPDVPDGTVLDDEATVDASTPDPDGTDNSDMESTTVEAEADLAIGKTSNKDIVNSSDFLIYTVTVANNGPSDAQDVVVFDDLPLSSKKVRYVFDTDTCVYAEATNDLTCSLGTIAAGSAVSFEITVEVKGNLGMITNTATVSSSTTDPVGANNTASKTVLVRGHRP